MLRIWKLIFQFHSATKPFWHQVDLFRFQLFSLYAGYQEAMYGKVQKNLHIESDRDKMLRIFNQKKGHILLATTMKYKYTE